MTWIRLRLALLATACAVLYITGGVFGPTIVLACEGGGGEPRIVNKEGGELVKNKFTGTSSATKVVTPKGTQISCKKDTVDGTETEEAKGKMTTSLKECKNQLNAECTGGTGAANGELIIPVSWTLQRSLEEGKVLLLDSTVADPPFGFKCGTVDGKMKGSFLIVVKLAKLGVNQEFEIAQKEGIQEPAEYENEKKEKIKATLELSIEEGAFEQAGIEGNEETTFEEEVEFLV